MGDCILPKCINVKSSLLDHETNSLHRKQKNCLPNLKNYTITGISWRKGKRHIWIQWGLVFVCRIKWQIEKLNRAHLFIKCPLLKCILSNFWLHLQNICLVLCKAHVRACSELLTSVSWSIVFTLAWRAMKTLRF